MYQNDFTSKVPEYKIALVMAGGVSGGAYTAGVLDYLFEALEKWEEAKKNNLPGVPKHKVTIEILSGASSGGICCAVTAAALLNKFDPVNNVNDENSGNKLFETWVNRIDIKHLLDDNDLKNSPDITSLLNSNIIEEISHEIICDDEGNLKPKPGQIYNRDYISKNLDIVITLANIRGITYELVFGNNDRRPMVMHEDKMRFNLKLNDSGNKSESLFTDPDIPALPLVPQNNELKKNWVILRNSSRATSAFPIGLKAVKLTKSKKDIKTMRFPVTLDECKDGKTTEMKELPVKWPDGDAADNYEFLNFDGGLLNNEPFSIARQILAHKQGLQFNERDPKKAKASVIIIDPSPVKEVNDKDFINNSLFKILPKLVNLVLSSLRFRKEDLVLAADENIHSRYLVLPKRSSRNKKNDININVTAELLGGFGGFLDIDFRRHDFSLGRRNCQRFLKEHFALDPSNPIAKYSENTGVKYKSGDEKFIQIIPVIDQTKIGLPPAPLLNEEKLLNIHKLIGNRLKSLALRMIKDLPKASILKTIMYVFIAIITFPGNIIIALGIYFIVKKKLFDSLKEKLAEAGVYKSF